jgi:hypothetical protein
MQAHLSLPCAACSAKVGILSEVRDTILADSKYEVPDHIVHSARSIFALRRPERFMDIPRLLAKLTFDSLGQLSPAGVRSQQWVTRQTLYQAGRYSIDLRMEREKGSAKAVLVGQIINRNAPEQRTAYLPVVLMAGKEILGRTLSNKFGEFQIECQPRPALQLFVPVENEIKAIEVRLDKLFPKQ